jgi:hypothetical protein
MYKKILFIFLSSLMLSSLSEAQEMTRAMKKSMKMLCREWIQEKNSVNNFENPPHMPANKDLFVLEKDMSYHIICNNCEGGNQTGKWKLQDAGHISIQQDNSATEIQMKIIELNKKKLVLKLLDQHDETLIYFLAK